MIVARRPPCAQVWDSGCALMARDFCCETCRTTLCDNSDAVLRLVEVSGTVMLNQLTVRGGNDFGLVSNRSDITVDLCTFGGNPGISIVTFYGSASILRSCFSDNGLFDSYSSGGGVLNESNQAVVSDCEFLRNRGGGLGTGSSAPIRRCTFRENIGTALTVGKGFPTISDCVFMENMGNSGGAIRTGYLSGLRIERSLFLGNVAGSGGAIFNDGSMAIFHSLFLGNWAGNDGAILSRGSLRLDGCTLAGNWAYGTTGGIGFTGSIEVNNCILWGNYDQYLDEYGYYQRAQLGGLERPTVRYSIVHGWTGEYGGGGNSSVDPLLMDPDGPDNLIGTEDDDLRLSPDSPAINAGDPSFCLEDKVELCHSPDLDGHARILCSRIDIGAYEFGIGDYDCDRTVDLTDFANWQTCMTGPSTAATSMAHNPVAPAPGSDSQSAIGNRESAIPCQAFDFNADGSIDLLDFAAFQSLVANQ